MRLNIIVRAKRDADAVKAMLRLFYEDWDITVRTLKGVRSPERALDMILEVADTCSYNVVLVGRRESSWVRLQDKLPPNVVVHVVPRSKVRNARLEMLAGELKRAKARFRNSVAWAHTFLFYPARTVLLPEALSPAYDNFLGLGEGFRHMVERVLGADLKPPLLLFKGIGGVHVVFKGPRPIAELHMPDLKPPHGRLLEGWEENLVETSLDDMIKANEHALEVFEHIALEGLKRLSDSFDTVIVPWSGGKDSTAALLLALKAFRRDKVIPIYVDTGVDFPVNIDYLEEVSRSLGVKYEVAYADVRGGLSRLGLPTHEDRWCTKLKIEALYAKIREVAEGRVLIVVGDRDAESVPRGRRPFTRLHEDYYQAAPLKMWSGSQVQLYLLSSNIPLNPLYYEGFYRIGCYVCPALRGWELEIMKTRLYRRLEGLPWFKEFMEWRSRVCRER